MPFAQCTDPRDQYQTLTTPYQTPTSPLARTPLEQYQALPFPTRPVLDPYHTVTRLCQNAAGRRSSLAEHGAVHRCSRFACSAMGKVPSQLVQ